MFGLRSKKPEEAPAGALDRLGRRNSTETRADAQPAAVGKEARLAAVAAALHDAVAPRLRDMVKAGASAGEITRQAGLLAQQHFRGNGVLLAPLELRGYVAEVLRPVLPATSFAQPAVTAAEPAPAEAAPAPVPATTVGAVPTPDLSERPPQSSAAVLALQPRPVEPAKP
jgi:pilus assembly protein CpaF